MSIDTRYVDEILSAIGERGNLTRAEFEALCVKDLNAGYTREVRRAWTKYAQAHPTNFEKRDPYHGEFY